MKTVRQIQESWGHVLDYIGVKWENEPGQLTGQMSLEDYAK